MGLKYVIKELKNGLLLDPLYHWDDKMFDEYETIEEAIEQIESRDHCWGELVILTVYTKKCK